MAKYRIIDLFCGCGGFSKGFLNAGFEVLLGIDHWEDATNTYAKNFPNTKVLTEDITSVSGKQITDLLNCEGTDIDVIIGGPPCQGFSVSGWRLVDDPRNVLYKSFVKIVEQLQPKMFVMENVPGLVRLYGGKIKDEVIKDFSNIGYNVSCQLLHACNYGVPQTRKRVFFVGLNKQYFKSDRFFEFPKPTHGEGLIPYLTTKEAIGDLPTLSETEMGSEVLEYPISPLNLYQESMRRSSKLVYNHVATMHTKKTREIISMVPDGGNYKTLPKELWSTRKVNIAWTRMNSNKPCFTIDTGHNHHFHYEANRVPTVRESARIQSFPDDFIYYGIKTSQLKQVGNAVPPILAQVIASKMMELLEERKDR